MVCNELLSRGMGISGCRSVTGLWGGYSDVDVLRCVTLAVGNAVISMFAPCSEQEVATGDLAELSPFTGHCMAETQDIILSPLRGVKVGFIRAGE